jgi:hypothetical protein
MIIAGLKGGLGNQMFQYAAGRRLALKHQTCLKLDTSFLEQKNEDHITVRRFELSLFNLEADFATAREISDVRNFKNRLFSKLNLGSQNPYVQEKFFQFDPAILRLPDNVYLDGHWMTEKYFTDVESVIRNDFSFRNPVLPQGRNILDRIQSGNSICIQVRRGDYVLNPKVLQVHGVTSIEFFRRAINFISSKITNPEFFIFSDDSTWCVDNFGDLQSVCFVEKELEKHGAKNSDYLQLMSRCKHFIISNSTYGWWGAWLSNTPGKLVVAPTNWFVDKTRNTQDIYPESWIKM